MTRSRGTKNSAAAAAYAARLALVALALATPADAAQRPVRSLLEYRQANVVIQSWDNSCGAAALATVLTYAHAFPISEENVARGMLKRTDPLRVRHRGGFSLLDMKRLAETLGFAAEGYSDLTLAELAEMPFAIVPIRVRGYNHFVVVREVDGDTIDIADPGFGNYTLPAKRFLTAWQGQIGFLVEKRR